MMQIGAAFALVVALLPSPFAQPRGRGAGGGRVTVGVAPVPLPDGPVVFDTAEQHKIRVVVVTKELSHPWGMAWLPQRIRDVRQGLDGFLYVLTDEDQGVLPRIEPAN